MYRISWERNYYSTPEVENKFCAVNIVKIELAVHVELKRALVQGNFRSWCIKSYGIGEMLKVVYACAGSLVHGQQGSEDERE